MESGGYQAMEGQNKGSRVKTWIIVVLCLCLIGLAVFTGIYVVDHKDNDNDGSSECVSEQCISMAETLLETMDESVDPCEDFFQYACGSWIDSYDWELVQYQDFGQFNVLSDTEQQTILDAMYEDTNETLIGHTSVQNAITFFSSCQDSTVDEEDIESSELLQEFVAQVNFSDGTDAWDTASIAGFTEAMAWLSGRDWNVLFSLQVYAVGAPLIMQAYDYWLSYDRATQEVLLNTTFIPLYMSVFGLTEDEATAVGDDVLDFMDAVANITTATWNYYDYNWLMSQIDYGTNYSVLGSNDVVNYQSIAEATYEVTADEIPYIVYFNPGLEFLSDLATLVKATKPETVQYMLFTEVLYNMLDFEESLTQSRSVSRVDFCFYQFSAMFPYVYGYLIRHEMYSTEKYEKAYEMVETVVDDGIRTSIENADWMDADSLEESLRKVDNLGIYVGFPPKIGDGDFVDTYYDGITQSADDFLGNLGELKDFTVAANHRLITNTSIDITSPWPADFADTSSFPYWLTGINAFYSPQGNFFTIPVTITQEPFFDDSYPSSINFGGLGSVIGHEISHGFDPSGSYFNYNGTYHDIWTPETRQEYSEKVKCFINQYSLLEIQPGLYDDGNLTKTENVADNGGITASYRAWQVWKESHDDNYVLPGLALTDDQLFFMAWGRVWCDAFTSAYYKNWTDVHSANNVRVWGAVQNSDEFASAFGCEAGSDMNPVNKCTLW